MNSTIILYGGIFIGLALIGVAAFVALRSRNPAAKKATKTDLSKESLEKMAREDVDRIFNDEFREELRNMGRLHFQKVVSDNAMFLKEDLRLTSSQLNEFLKSEVTRHLEESFKGYDQSLSDAKDLAIESVQKITVGLEQQHEQLTSELTKSIEVSKTSIIEDFQTNMADVISHYLLTAVGNQVDLSDQLDYILAELEKNKSAIEEDLRL